MKITLSLFNIFNESIPLKKKIMMKKSTTEIAIETFRSGLNCAQAVLTSFSEELNFDKELALRTSCGFGGGMGRMGGTCGAVTGSYMVLGMINCEKFTDNKDRKASTYSMVQSFTEKFKIMHGTTDCHSLLNCEIITEEGHRYAAENKLFEKVCEKCIEDSIRIIGEVREKKSI